MKNLVVPKEPLGFKMLIVSKYYVKIREAIYVYKHNIEVHPGNFCWHGKVICIKYYEHMIVVFRSHHAMRMRNIFNCSLTGSKIFFLRCPIKRTILGARKSY